MTHVKSVRLMRLVRSVFFISLIFAVASPAAAGIFRGKTKFYTIKTEHFYIHYNEGIGPLAEEMRGLCESVYERITQRLDWKPWGRTHIVMTDKTDVSNGLASVIPSNYILLYIAPPGADSSLDHYKNYFDLLLTHEFTHIAHIDQHNRVASPARWFLGKVVAPNGLTPAWMREGMAVFEESALDPEYGRNNSDFSRMVIRTAYYENKFPRLDQIAGSSAHFPAGSGPYIFGGTFFDWLAKKYGEDRMYKYQKEYASSLWLFSLNNKARRVYGESFYKLWKEFRNDLAQEFDAEKAKLTTQGLTSFAPVVVNKNSQNYYTPRPGSSGGAWFESSFDEANAIYIALNAGEKPIVIKRSLFGQMSFSKNGRYLAFSSLAAVEPKTSHAEVFYYDTKDRKLFRVFESGFKKKSMRVMDPDFSPSDGGQRWLVMVRDYLNTDQLYIFDTYEKKGYTITTAPEKTQFSNPRFSPDGQSIVVSRKNPDGKRDIVIYDNLGREIKTLTNDTKDDNHPVFSADGSAVFYDSFRTGIANIFRYDLRTGHETQVTNVLGGVFQPMIKPDGTLYVRAYGSDMSSIYALQTTTTGNVSPVFVQPVAKDEENILQTSPEKKTTDKDEKNDDVPTTEDIKTQTNLLPGQEWVDWDDGKKSGDDVVGLPQTNQMDGHDHARYKSLADQNPYFRFSLDPESAELLPSIVSGGEGRKTDRDEVVNETSSKVKKSQKSTSQKTSQQTTTQTSSAPKEYPSSYKSVLQQSSQPVSVNTANAEGSHKYSALPQILVPRYVVPSLLTYEDSVLFGVAVGRFDPLYRHSWTLSANYRSDARFVGSQGTYIYSRWDPVFYVGGVRYVVDWGDVNGVNFFEQRHQAYAGVAYAHKKNKFNLAYFYEHRDALTNLAGVNLVNMKPYAGFRTSWTLTDYESYSDSISQENGYRIKVGFEWTNTLFGADDVNEERVVYADARYYLEMPWSNHHVLAFRAAGGWVWGDVQQFGAYRMGGPFGEGTGAGYSSRLFPLRGLPGITYGGDRAFIFSAEYRLPLVYNVNRGIGTWPVFLDKLYMDFFVDGGDIKYRTELPDLFTRVMISAGAELKGDVVLGYGLPMTFRAGYGIILTNTDRLGTLTDPVTGAALKYGSAYLQVGTSF